MPEIAMIVRLLMADCHPPQCHLKHNRMVRMLSHPQTRPANLSFCVYCFHSFCLLPSYTTQSKSKMHVAHSSLFRRYHTAVQGSRVVAMAAHSELGCCMLWGAMLLTRPLFSALHCCLIAADLSGNTKWNSIPCTLALYISAFKPSVSDLIYISLCMRLKIQQLDVFTRDFF